MEKQRLDKFIANQLNISRRDARNGIRKGNAAVNGSVITDAACLLDVGNDKIEYEGNSVDYKKFIYIIMNKPAGVLSAATDKSRKTVIDLVPEGMRRQGLFPVGRLDKDTTGMLIITDDGEFAHNCISPKKMIPKAYIAELDGPVNDTIINKFKSGIVLADGTVCKSAILERLNGNTVRIIITEGKYHQIKRMFGTQNLGVNKLHRESIGKLRLPQNLKAGECVELSRQELENTVLFKPC